MEEVHSIKKCGREDWHGKQMGSIYHKYIFFFFASKLGETSLRILMQPTASQNGRKLCQTHANYKAVAILYKGTALSAAVRWWQWTWYISIEGEALFLCCRWRRPQSIRTKINASTAVATKSAILFKNYSSNHTYEIFKSAKGIKIGEIIRQSDRFDVYQFVSEKLHTLDFILELQRYLNTYSERQLSLYLRKGGEGSNRAASLVNSCDAARLFPSFPLLRWQRWLTPSVSAMIDDSIGLP